MILKYGEGKKDSFECLIFVSLIFDKKRGLIISFLKENGLMLQTYDKNRVVWNIIDIILLNGNVMIDTLKKKHVIIWLFDKKTLK